MKSKKAQQDLQAIRTILEKSSRPFTLTGFSGILISMYVFVASGIAWYGFLQNSYNPETQRYEFIQTTSVYYVLGLALILFTITVSTAWVLGVRNAQKQHIPVWNAGTKALLQHISFPIVIGAVLSLGCFKRELYELIPGITLLFYGMALFSGSKYTNTEIKVLGISQTLLGILALTCPAWCFELWVAGFGGLHLVYGLLSLRRKEGGSRK
jgi:hypothetical protein